MCLTKEEFDNLLYTGDEDGNDNDCIFKYYNLLKRLYNMSYNTKILEQEALNNHYFDFLCITNYPALL